MRRYVAEYLVFASRTIADNLKCQVPNTVALPGEGVARGAVAHGLRMTSSHGDVACVVITDGEYPSRSAMLLVHRQLRKLLDVDHCATISSSAPSTPSAAATGVVECKGHRDADKGVPAAVPAAEAAALQKDLDLFQDPTSVDRILRVEHRLLEVKETLVCSLDLVIRRGETLDSLVQKSRDLSVDSKRFYIKAKKNNQCCKAY
jgi:acetolactate synthase regulatory subunit